VIPNEYGLQKNPFFCFSWLCKKFRRSLKKNDRIEAGFLSNLEENSRYETEIKYEAAIEDASSALYHQPFLNKENKKVNYFLKNK